MDNELNDYEKALLLQRFQDAEKKSNTMKEVNKMWNAEKEKTPISIKPFEKGISMADAIKESFDVEGKRVMKSAIMMEKAESVSGQSRYDGGNLEAIVVIEALGLLLASRGVDPKKIYALQQVVRYIWRLGAKDAMDTELGKAENYIHRARTGEWLEK